MVNIPRIHCHSAFKHYQMFHSYENSYGSGSIFNTTYNFNGGGMCGGGFWGGLWGGLGMGLGAGLMNLLGGGLFGGGMMGGFPMMGMWGIGGGYRDGIGGKINVKPEKDTDNTDNNTSNHVCKKCEDKDGEICNAFQARIFELKNKNTITQEDIDKLRDEITEAKGKNDKYHKTVDETHYNDLLKQLDDIKPNKPEPPQPVPTPEATDPVNFALQFAKHDNPKIKDTDIRGSIVGVKMENGKPIGYIIDCSSDSNSTYKLKYEVTINGNIYTIRCISRTHNASTNKKSLWAPAEGIKFKKEGKLLVRVTESDEPLVSETHKEGYNQEIKFSETEDDTQLLSGYTPVENGEATIDGKKVKVTPDE